MKSLLVASLCFMSIALSAVSSRADLILRLAQTTPTGGAPLPLNNPSAGIFSIFVSSTVANQGISGIGFRLSLSSVSGAGGTMASGTFDLPSSGLWTNPAGWMAGSFPGTTTAVLNTAVGAGGSMTIGTSEQLLATVTLSTVGATDGFFQATISEFEAGDAGFNELGLATNLSTLSLNYAAAPEPGSIALVCVAGLGAAWRYRRRNSAAK